MFVRPGLRPGASVPPALMATAPVIVPVPPRVAPAFTVTGPGIVPFTKSVPPFTVVPPANVLVPESERIPAPVFVMPDAPPMAPESVSVVALFTASAAESVSALARLCVAPEALSCGAAPAKVIACPVMA